MRLYEDAIKNFKQDVIQNKVADKISNRYQEYYKKRASPSEVRSWINSLNFLKNVLEYAPIEENKIIVEYELPYSEKRIDVMLFGKDEQGNENIVVIELKQWSNENVEDSENEGNVRIDYGKSKVEMPHPSLQIEGYEWHLKDFLTVFEEEPGILLSACVYCHNYNKGENETLYLPKFKKSLEKYPLFSKQEIMDFGNYLKTKLSSDPGFEVFGKFNHSILKPSKKLMEHTGMMIHEQKVFNLIDEQITSYNTIMHQAKNLAKSKEKSVIIIKGGPGTGKSVIALEVMAELLRKKINVVHATGSKAFTTTLRKILGKRSETQFKFFNSFIDKSKYRENEFDVLICDEAHRIRKTSESMYTPKHLRSGEPQIDELIRVAKLIIFFIDEHQVVRPTETGSINLIKKTAEKFNTKVYEMPELKTQFRCGGSGNYLEKVEKILRIYDEDEDIELDEETKMGFKIVSSPNELKMLIDQKNREKRNSSRMVAGFCWPWSKPNRDGSLVNDVKIGDFEMPWEHKDEFWRWATEDSGMDQVGTVYTSQGFEFDYIGVIFGNDLVWNKETKSWYAKPENSHDSMAKRGNDEFAKHLKNVYRVLLTRAHKGVFVYFVDKDTEAYFKENAKKLGLSI
ncbi:DUF2075 domain-containing protein [Candidatus Woesearchaeota archaeon]|nr:DUF2075 domain-containing protein [Candidatus Woesearchaeota archaeon]